MKNNNKPNFDVSKAWGEADKLYEKKKFIKCTDVLEEIIEHIDNAEASAHLCYVKANVFIEINDTISAKNELDRALRFSPTHSQAYHTRARITYYIGNDLAQALTDADSALTNFTPSNLSESVTDADSLSNWVQGYVAERSDIINLKTSIESDIRSNQLYEQMRDLELKINSTLREERQRNFETIGVFAAIIALILATTQSATRLQGLDFVWLSVGLVVPVGFLVLLVTPRIDSRIKGLTIILSMCLAAGLVGFLIRGYTG